jgi:NADH-quinone oxidoreductase subunit F
VLIDELGGGPRPGRTLKAIFSGTSNAVLTADDLDEPLSFEGLQQAGLGLGSAGFIVYDDTACMVKVAALLSRFLYVESCEQCVPCKFGSGEITAALERLIRGEGSAADVDKIRGRCGIVATGNRCALPVGERLVVTSILNRFTDEFINPK